MSSEWISLGRVGIVPKGEYSSTTSYNRGDMVFYENASYIAIKNNLINITPVNDNINWTMSMKAYEELPATNVYVNDTYNIVGNGAGSKGILQTFLDTVANKLGIFGESKDGLVPKPSATEGKFLCDDGTWKNPLQGVSSVSTVTLYGKQDTSFNMGDGVMAGYLCNDADCQNVMKTADIAAIADKNITVWFAADDGNTYVVKPNVISVDMGACLSGMFVGGGILLLASDYNLD